MARMRVYISIDMEGVAGVVHGEQCRRGGHGYDEARALMTAEANAAALGAFAGGAEHVLINDSHGDMRNLVLDQLDERVEIITGALKPFSMVEGLGGESDFGGRGPEQSLDHHQVALFIGYHAGMGTAAAILDHTYRGAVVSQVRINGREFNEAGLNALVAGAAGTPVGLVTGDESTCRQCRELLGEQLETVTVKWAIGRTAARSLHPRRAQQRIREAATRVVGKAAQLQSFLLDSPYVLEIDVHDTAMADAAAILPGVLRPYARTLRYEAGGVHEVFRAMLSIVKLGGTAL
jgi:D-amino peptidase